MKSIIFIILHTFAATILQAQSVNFKWAKLIGGSGIEFGISIAVDSIGNIYTTGSFEGTTDFDPGPGIYNLSSAGAFDIFISKLDSSGNFIWAKQIGGVSSLGASGSSVIVDVAGNIYTTGFFDGTVDFDPGPVDFNISTIYSRASFILKLDPGGNFVWAKQIGGGGEEWVGGNTIITDATGNIYTSGSFQNTQDFDPGPAILNLEGGGGSNIYISKFDSSGNLIWAKSAEHTFYSSNADQAFIAIDGAGNIYCTGKFGGTVDFDPGVGVYQLTSVCPKWSIYVWKLNAEGNFVWAKQMEGLENNSAFTISVDTSGDVYTSGFFWNIVDFDPGPGIYNIKANGFHKYLSKLTTNGDFVWAKIDDYAWDYSGSTTVDAAGNIYTTGGFENTVDFDPGPGIFNLTSFGKVDIFIRKVGKCTGSTSNSLTIKDCKGYTLNGYTYTKSGIYTQTITNTGGCDSIITLNLTINSIYADEYITTCTAYTWHCHSFTNCNGTSTRCLTFNSSGVYVDTIITPNACDSIITLHLTVAPPILTTITKTICNGQTYNGYITSNTYIDSFLSVNGCDSIRTLELTVLPTSFSTIAKTICNGQTYVGHSSSGTYIDTLVTANGCDSIQTLQLTVLAMAPDLGPDTALCVGQSIQLHPGQFTTYTWQDGSSQNHFTVTQPGLYNVVVSNSCGSGTDEIIIKEGICNIYFPTAFTPNNDGKNDLFKILGANNIKDYHFAVYNRYGQKVFETTDYTKGWTGNVKGQLQNTGVYTWYCNFKKSGSQENIAMKGTVTLIR